VQFRQSGHKNKCFFKIDGEIKKALIILHEKMLFSFESFADTI